MSRPTVARVFSAHLKHNARRARALASRSRLLACVKANGYGHGIVDAARALDDCVDGYAVACMEEAATLRDAGFDARIVLLEGPADRDEVGEAADRDLTLCISEPHQLAWVAEFSRPSSLDCWLKVDTGMHRLGFAPESLEAAARELLALPALRHKPVICTHFARADEPGKNGSQEQLEDFDRATASLPLPQSCANSAAIIRYPGSHRDWVRPGYMLYGGCPLADSDARSQGLRPGMELRSRVIALRDVASGESVGYGGRWRARRPSRIATIAIGYGDGYPRHAPDGTPVMVDGVRVPIAGKVSMDMLTVDVTDHPDARVGAPAILWGEDPAVDEIASYCGTIGYELLAALPARVKRVIEQGLLA